MMARLHSSAFSLLSDFDRVGHDVASVPSPEDQLKSTFEDGHRQGHAEGRAEAEADADLLIAESRIRHAEELIAERANWQRDCADALIGRLESAAKMIEHNIEERVAALLEPFLIGRLRDRALRDLERAISRALVEGAKIHIEAPPEIIERLREQLPSESFQIGYSESSDADIRAHIEDTSIEANISTWIAELEAAMS
jgi:flagellar biosynthesis/type III secretory pathway protein FliH